MKKQTQTTNFNVKFIVIGVSLALGLSACTKSRDTKIADEAADAEIMSISELEADGYQIQLGDSAELFTKNKALAVNEKPSFEVKKVKAPEKISGPLKTAQIQGKSGQTYALKFKLQQSVKGTTVFVMREIDDLSELSVLQADLIEKMNGKNYLPTHTIGVKAVGILIKQKNDYGEQSYKLELRETSLSKATHVRLNLQNDFFAPIQLTRGNEEAWKRLFTNDQLENLVTSIAELEQLIQVDLDLQGDARQKNIVTKVLKDTLSAKTQILIYQAKKRSEVSEDSLLEKLDSHAETNDIQSCSEIVKQQTNLGEDCVIELVRSVEATSVRAKQELDELGKPTGTVVLDNDERNRSRGLIQVTPDSASPAGVHATDELNKRSTIRVADIKGNEFLFRRTFADAASSLTAFGPGASGGLEIVKFDLEEDRLVVRRADTVNSERNATDIDKEELMSIPAKYYRLKSSSGVTLLKPERATAKTADVVLLDWRNNTLPTTASPLAYFDAGQCFAAVGSQSVDDVDMRLNQGVLNFSIRGSYTFRTDCLSPFRMNDYWYGSNLQTTFNLSERISFKLYDRSRDTMANQDLPFRAQTMMGVGIFTLGKRVPDQFGNFGRVNNEIAMPVIQDFANGKVMTYVLGGLPADPKYKQIFIDSTKRVIADWNETLHKSFKGTSLDRSGNYIDLKIDGVDIAPGHLGDLDRNYIWNFEKNLDSGLLGMSQAGPNPRTGISEQNNVLMYSGNLLSYVASLKKAGEQILKYDEMKAKAAQAIELKMREEQAAEQQSSQKQSNSGGAAASQSEAQRLIQEMNQIATKSKVIPMTPRLAINTRNAKSIGEMVKAIQSTSQNLAERKTLTASSISFEKDYLRKIVDRALDMNALRDPMMLKALSAAEVLKAYGNRLSQDEKLALSIQTRRMALAAEFNKNFKNVPGCIFEGSVLDSARRTNYANRNLEELFARDYALTLSHEIGHSLGLTHNFKGSIDKANFQFNDSSQGDEKRTYSTVMDYQAAEYSKPGPYDVHALRVAYTGLIEVADRVQRAAKEIQGRKFIGLEIDGKVKAVELNSGKFISMTDLKEAVVEKQVDSNSKSWWNVDAKGLSKVPLKFYHFCTDVHVGGDPTCNRWDAGTTPTEIVQFYIQEYNDLYPIYNNRGDRINAVDLGQYISRIMMNFMGARQFMDETFYRAIQGYSDVGDYASAAFQAYKFFLNNFNTPHTNADVMSEDRFSPVSYTKTVQKVGTDGKPVIGKDGEPETEQVKAVAVVEAKPTKDIFEDGGAENFLVRTRGIEFDKALSMMMLTQRDFGNPRYSQVGLRLSFAEFEKYAMQMPASQSLIMRSLGQTMADNMTSVVFVDGGIAQVPASLAPQTSDLIRYYTVLSSAVFLEADTLEDKDNFAALFRVGSSLTAAPRDRLVVTKSDQVASSRGALKYWAFDNATVANELIRSAAQKRLVLDRSAELTKALDKVLSAKNAEEQKAALAENIKLFESMNKLGVLLSEEEKKAGLKFENLIAQMAKQAQEISALVLNIQEQAAAAKIPEDQVLEIAKDITSQAKTANLVGAKDSALLMISGKLVIQKFSEKPLLKSLAEAIAVNESDLKTNLGVVVNNLQTLNKLVNSLNPELNR